MARTWSPILVVAGSALVGAGCGDDSALESASRPPQTFVEEVAIDTSVDVAPVDENPGPTGGVDQPFVLGEIEFVLPSTAGDFLQPDALPDFAIAARRWSLGDLGVLNVGLQAEVPLFSSKELVDRFESNGLSWAVYDTGKLSGLGATCFARLPSGSSVLVVGEAWSDVDDAQTVVAQVLSVCRSVKVTQGS